ncbi:hypothetical protein HBN50_05140 [Halobacteriovorax sp. GB3]|uniref:hypothetical protein n=1 Tax=Halobacteriovorax sp. GB3 TaxID=2719615 RepID=UPI002362168E|nr:hypothetical protein [Halobacteriovorax sp. GB3]MDD0852470.1 hypothetical protein [Halobacteriovorax sp. GB3]
MKLLKLILLSSVLVFFTACMGAGNTELEQATFGLKLTVLSGDGQVLEDPSSLADEVVVKLTNASDDSPVANASISFVLENADSGAKVLTTSAITSSAGIAKTKVVGADDFGKKAIIRVLATGTGLEEVVVVSIRNKIIPTKIAILDPPANVVAGIPFDLQLRLVDDNGRVSEEPDFNTEISVDFSSISGNISDSSRFNKTNPADRIVKFVEGVGVLTAVTYTTAEDLTITLRDHGKIPELEAITQRAMNISEVKTMRIVPSSPTRMQLDDPTDGTTDDTIAVVGKLYDQYDNFAYNYSNACQARYTVAGDNLNQAWIVDSADPSARNQTGIATFNGGRGQVNVKDTNVETVTITINNVTLGCGGLSNYGTAQDVRFDVGQVAKIEIRAPVPDTKRTTEEISLLLEATDAGGNFVSSYNGKVGIEFDPACSATINIADHDGTNKASLNLGTKTVRVSNTNLDRKPTEECTVSLSSTTDTTGIDLTSSQKIYFTPGLPKQFAFVQTNYTGEVGWGTLASQRNPTTIDVEVLDTYGNPVTTYSGGGVDIESDGTTEISTTDADGSTNPKTISIAANGKGTATVWGLKNETVTLKFTNGPAGMRFTTGNSENVPVDNLGNSTSSLYFKWGIPSYIEIVEPTDGSVDAAIPLTITAYDYGGNQVNDYGTAGTPISEIQVVADSGTAVFDGPVSFVGGQSTVNVSNTVEETVNLSLNFRSGVTSYKNSKGQDINITDAVKANKDVYFKWGTVGRKFVITDPPDTNVDTFARLRVQVVDQFNNPVRDYGCGGDTQDVAIAVNGTARLSQASTTNHTDDPTYTALSQTEFVDIKLQTGSCPITNTTSDASYGDVFLFNRSIAPFGSDFQTVGVTMSDSDGTGYSLTPTGGVISVNFAPGTHTTYNILDSVGTVDAPIRVPVQAVDQFGNLAVTYVENDAVTFRWVDQKNADINLDADNNPTTTADNRASGDLFVDFLSGDRGEGYIYLSDTVSESITVGLELKSGYTTSKTATILFNSGVVTNFAIVPPSDPSTITTDDKVLFNIRALDQYGNINTSYEDDIKVSVNKSAGILTNPTETDPTNFTTVTNRVVDISSGVGTIYVYDPVKETVTMSMIDELGRTLTLPSIDVDFLHGQPVTANIAQVDSTQFNYPSLISSNVNADTPGLVTVEIRDQNGNIADTFTDDVNLVIRSGNAELVASAPAQNDIPNTGLNQTRRVNISSGVGTLYVNSRAVGAVTLHLDDSIASTGLTMVPSSVDTPITLNVQHGTAERFGIYLPTDIPMTPGQLGTLPSGVYTGNTDNDVVVAVNVYDHYHNLATSFGGDVTLTVDKNAIIDSTSIPVSSNYVDTKNVKLTMVNGTAVFDIYDYQVENSVSVTLSGSLGTNAGNLDTSHARLINFTFGAPSYFAIVKPGVDAIVDNPSSINVEVRDQRHNVITSGFQGSVDFTVDGSAFLNDASDINPTTGLVASPMKTRTITFGPTSTGVESINVYDRTSETVTFSLSNGSETAPGTNSLAVVDAKNPAELKNQYFAPGAEKDFQIQTPATIDGDGNHVTADNSLVIEVRAFDKYGNFKNDLTAADLIQLQLSLSGRVVGADDITPIADDKIDFGGSFPQGVGRIKIRDTVAETIDLTLADHLGRGYTGNTVQVKVRHGNAYDFIISNALGSNDSGTNPTLATRADVEIDVEVTARDAFQNTVENFAGKANLAFISGTAGASFPSGQTISTWTNGVGQIAFTKTVVGDVTVEVQDHVDAPTMLNTDPSAQRTITIVHGLPNKFAFLAPTPPIRAGEEIAVTIEAQDVHGNKALSYGGAGKDVQVEYRNGVGTIKDGASFVSGPLTYELSAGSATVILKKEAFAATSYPNTDETIQLGFLTASDGSMDVTDTESITFTPNDPVELIVVVDPTLNTEGAGPFSIDSDVSVRLEARDAYGNFNDEYTGTVNFTSNKDSWIYQDSVSWASQNRTIQSENISITGGAKIVKVADLTAETSVTLGLNTPVGGSISTLTPAQIDFMHGVGTTYNIIFVAQPAATTPTFTTDKQRGVQLQVLDQGGNIVLNHATHDVRMTHNGVDANFTGDDGADEGKVSVTNGTADFFFDSRRTGNITLGIDPALYDSSLSLATRQVKIDPGTVSTLAIVAPASTTADTLLISDNTYTQPACGAAVPGAAPCPKPTDILRVEPRDKYGNVNNIEGAGKTYDVTLKAIDTATLQERWSENVKITEGKTYLNDGVTLFNQQLIRAENVRFTLSAPTPSSQLDEDGNTVNIDVTSNPTATINPGVPAKIWIVQPTNNSIDNPIEVTVEVQDGHDIDGNGNGNLVPTAPDYAVDFTLSSASGLPVWNGKGTNDPRDSDTTDTISGDTITIKKGVGVFNLESTRAESVDIGLTAAPGGVPSRLNDGDSNVFFGVSGQTKTVVFSPGIPNNYKISPPANGTLYDAAEGDELKRFNFEVKAYDRGGNFKNTVNGSVIVDASIADGTVTLYNSDESQSGTGSLIINLVNGVGNVKFTTTKSGTVALSLRKDEVTPDPVGIDVDSTSFNVTVSPGPVTVIALDDPVDIRTTTSNSMADVSDNTKMSTTSVVARAYDTFGNFNNAFTGSVLTLASDSANMEMIKVVDSTASTDLSFSNGQASLLVRNKTAETVNLTLNDTYNQFSGVNITATQNVVFSPGPVSQVSLEVPASSEAPGTTLLDTDGNETFTVRLRDIYGNPNTDATEGTLTNELNLSLTLETNSTGDFDSSPGMTTKVQSFSNGVGTFTVQLRKFGNDRYDAASISNLGRESGMEHITVNIDSSASSLANYNNIASRKIYFKNGGANFITLDDPDPLADKTIDDTVTVRLKARDLYGNLDIGHGTPPINTVNLTVDGNAIINGSSNSEMIAITNGVGTATVTNTVAETVNLNLGAGSEPISGTPLAPPVSTDYSRTQDLLFSPGAVTSFAFAASKQTSGSIVSSANVGTVTNDSTPERITVDNAAEFYLYAIDQGGNIVPTFNENDRISISANKGATVNTAESTYGDFIAGESKVTVSHTVDEVVRLTINKLNGADSSVTTNNIDIDFDHGLTSTFAWNVPTGLTVDNVANVVVQAQDQYGNNNDNYAGQLTFSGAEAVNDPLIIREPYISSDANDTDPSDNSHLQQAGGYQATMSGGSLTLNLMALRSTQYNLNIDAADETSDSNGSLSRPSTTIAYQPGFPINFEIYEITDGSYSPYTSSGTINIIRASDGSTLNTDKFARIGIQALDRGGNRSLGYTQPNALSLTSSPNTNVDFILPGGATWNAGGGNGQSSIILGFLDGTGVVEAEMRSKDDSTFSLSLGSLVTGTEKNAGNKQITFAPGQFRQVAFPGSNVSTVKADATFPLNIEARDNFNNLATDYTGFVRVGLETSPGTIVFPGDAGFPADVVFPAGDGGRENGVIEIVNGVGSLAGFEGHTAGDVVKLVIVEDTFDFDQSGGIGPTTFSHSVTVTAGDPASIVYASTINDVVVDNDASFTLNVVDTYGNLCNTTNGTIDVHVNGATYGVSQKTISTAPVTGSSGASTSPSPGNSVSFTNGTGTYNIHSQRADTVTVTISNPTIAGFSPVIPTPTRNFTFLPDTAQVINFVQSDYETDATPGNEKVGVDHAIYLAATDQFGNIANHNGSVTIVAAAPANMDLAAPGTVTFTNGRATQNIRSSITHTANLSLTASGGLTATDTYSVTFTPGDPHHMAFGNTVSDVVVGNSTSVILRVEDEFNNLCTQTSGNVELVIDAQATLDSNVKIGGSGGTASASAPTGNTTALTNGTVTLSLYSEKSDIVNLSMKNASFTLAGSTPYPSSVNFNFLPGNPVDIKFKAADYATSRTSGSTVAGTAYSIYLVARDQYQNTANFNGTVALNSNHTMDLAANGTVTFTNGRGTQDVNSSVMNHSVSLSLGAVSGAGSASITDLAETFALDIDHGAVDHFEFTMTPRGGGGNYTIDEVIGYTIDAVDVYGNLNNDFNGSVNVQSTQNSAVQNPWISGSPTTFLASGQNLTLSGGTYNLSVETVNSGPLTLRIQSASAGTIGQTASTTIDPGAITFFRVIEPNVGKVSNPANTDLKVAIDIEALDRGYNRITNFTSGVAIGQLQVQSVATSDITQTDITTSSTYSDENTPYEQSMDIISFTNGLSKAYIKSKAVAQYDINLNVTLGGTSLYDGAKRIEFEPGGTSKIIFSSAPTQNRADLTFNVTLQAQDAFGNATPDFTGKVKLKQSSGTGCTIPNDTVDFVSGSYTFTGAEAIQCTVAGDIQLGVENGFGTTVSDMTAVAPISIKHGQTNLQFFLYPITDTQVSNSTEKDVTIELRDQYGNFANTMASSYDVNLTAASDDNAQIYIDSSSMSSGTRLVTLPALNGKAVLKMRSTKAMAATLNLSDAGTGFPRNPSAGRSFNFTPGVASKLRYQTASLTQQTTDSFALEIHALDEFDNVAPTFGTSVTVQASDNTDLAVGSTGLVAMSSGKGTVNIQRTSPTSGSPVTFSLVGPAGIDVTTSFVLTVLAGPPSKVRIEDLTTPVGSRNVDHPGIPVNVTLVDQYDNPTLPSSGSVNVTMSVNSGPNAVWNDSAIADTVVTWTSATPETQTRQITSQQVGNANIGFTSATPSSIDITHNIFLNFAHGAASQYVFGTLPTNPGTDQTAVVNVRLADQYGNTCTSESSKSVTLNGTSVGGIAGTISGTGISTQFASGVAGFNVKSATRQDIQLSVVDSSGDGHAIPANQTINFVWGAPFKIAWKTLPTPVQVGNVWTVEAQIEDSNSNVLLEYSGSVNLATSFAGATQPDGSTPPDPTGGGTVAFSSGVAAWNLSGNGAGNLTLTASKASGDGSPGNANGVMVVEPASPSKIFIAPPGSSGIISQATTVQTILLDSFGNESKYNGTITFDVRASQSQTPTASDGYHDVATNPTSRAITFTNESQATFKIRKTTHGYVNVYVPSPPGGMSMQNSNGIDFHFQPGDPVEYALELPAKPADALFHSTVSSGDRDAAHAVSGVPVTVQVKAVDVTGAVASTWGGVVKVSVSGNGRLISNELVSLTSGQGSFELFNEYPEDVTITLEDQSSDNLGDTLAECTVLNTCQQTLVVKRSRAKEVKLTSNVSTIRAYSTNGQDNITFTATVYDESDNVFTSYRGDLYGTGCYGFNGGRYVEVRNGVGTKSCWDRYQATDTFSVSKHEDYTGALPIAMDSITFNTIHNTPTRAYLYCPDDSVAPTDGVERCYHRLTDNFGSGVVGSWGNAINDSDGYTIDIELRDNGGTINPNSIYYTDVNDDGIFDPADQATANTSGGTLDLTGTDGQRNFFVNNTQEEFVVINMANIQYTGGTWTAGQISAISIQNTQTVYFTPAQTTEVELTVTENPAAPNPTQDNSEYFTATLTAKTASGATSTAEDGFIYVDIITTGVANPIDTSKVYLEKNNAGSFSQSTSELVQFVNGIATVNIASRVTGDIKIRMRDPGTSGWTFTNNEPTKTFVPNPATKFINQDVATTRFADSTTQTITVYATDANDNIDTNFSNNVNVTFTLGGVDKRSTITNLSSNQIAFTNGVATLNVVTNEPGSYALTVGPFTGVTADSDNYSFSAPDPDVIIRSDSNTVAGGSVTIDVRAQKSNGVLASSFNGFYNITYKLNGAGTVINDGSIDDSSDNVALSSGVGQFTVTSSKAQTVDIEFSQVFTSGPSPTFATLTVIFGSGAPSEMVITQQPVGNVVTNTNLSQSLVIELRDSDGNVVTDATNTITLEGHVGAGCSSIDNTNFSYNGGSGGKTPTSGVVTFNAIQSAIGQTMSIKIKDSSGAISPVCTNSFSVYEPLATTLVGSATVNSKDERIIELSGGVPPLSVQSLTTTTTSTAVIVTSADPSCSVAQCVKYTAGTNNSAESIVIADGASNTDTINLTLTTPTFEFLNADNADVVMGSPHDLGQITNTGTFSRTVKIKNTGSITSGALSLTLTEDNANIWSLTDVDCIGTDLATNGTCTVDVNFHADSSEAAGSYSATLEVKGPNDAGLQTIQIDAEKLPPVSFLDSGNSPLSTTLNMGAFSNTSDNNVTIRVKHADTAGTSSGSLTVANTPDFADMWTITSDGCTGQNLAASGTCDIVLRFNSQTGSQSAGTYSTSLQVSGANVGQSAITVQATKNP